MKVRDYMGQLVDETVAKQLEELRKDDARDRVVEHRENASSDDTGVLTKEFYQAFLTHNPARMAEVNEKIEKDYQVKERKGYREKAQDIETIGSGTAGGVLVPTTVADSIVSKMVYISPIRQIATVISDMPAQLQLPSENTMAEAYWVSEGSPGTDSGEIFDPNLLTPWKLMGFDSFTEEVIADAATNPSIQNYVEQRFALALALLENAAFTNGSGSGQPYGFRSSAITPNTVAQAGDNLTYDDVVALKYSLTTAYRQIGVYCTSSSGVMALEQIKDNYGRPIWREGLSENDPDTLLGRPIYIIDEIPDNLGTDSNSTELWFGVFKNYFVGDRGSLRVDYGTNGTDFADDKISLRMAKRTAGRPVIGAGFGSLTGVLGA